MLGLVSIISISQAELFSADEQISAPQSLTFAGRLSQMEGEKKVGENLAPQAAEERGKQTAGSYGNIGDGQGEFWFSYQSPLVYTQ